MYLSTRYPEGLLPPDMAVVRLQRCRGGSDTKTIEMIHKRGVGEKVQKRDDILSLEHTVLTSARLVGVSVFVSFPQDLAIWLNIHPSLPRIQTRAHTPQKNNVSDA